LGSSTQLWHTQFRQLFADDLLVFVNVAVGELGTPGQGHIHAIAAQRNVRSNQLKAHLSDAASRKRVGLVCSSEALHSGIITSDSVLSKTAIFPQKEGRKGANGAPQICMGFVVPRDQRLGERQRRTA